MKKLWAVLLALVMTGSFAYAKGNPQSKSSGGVTKGMDRKIVMGYSQIGAESEWRTACTNSVKAAAEEYNIELIFSDAQQKQENQLQAIRSFIQRKVDIIAFTPVVSSGWEAILQECKEANIPVICVDRTIDGPDTLFTAFIGSDFKKEGVMAADWLVGYMDKIGRGSKDPVNVVELQGTVGAAAATDRQIGFMEVLAKHPNYKVIKTQTGNFTRSEGKQVMEAFLKSDGDQIDVLFAHNDDMAIGAIQAIEEYGRKPGEDIIIVSVDAVKGAFEAMIAGTLNASVECNPLLGPPVMETAIKILKKETVPKMVYSVDSTFDQSNAAAAFPTRKY